MWGEESGDGRLLGASRARGRAGLWCGGGPAIQAPAHTSWWLSQREPPRADRYKCLLGRRPVAPRRQGLGRVGTTCASHPGS